MNNSRGGWGPDAGGRGGRVPPLEGSSQLPPEYEPVHHEPRRRQDPPDGQTRPWAAPGRRQQQPPSWPQRPSRRQVPPQPAAPPQQARYEEPSRGYSGQYGDDGYVAAGGFMPGFAEGENGSHQAGWDDQADWVQPGAQQHGQREREREPQPQPQQPRRRRVRWLAPWLAVLVILTPVAIGGYYAYSLYQSKYHPADYGGAGTGDVQVQVKPGDTATSVAPELVNLGVIASSRALVLAAEHSTSNQGMEPGYYILHKRMQASLAYAILSNPKNIVLVAKVTLPEGLRKSAVISRLAAKTAPHIPLSAYQQALTSPSLGLPAYAKGNAEGFLFPSQYQIQPHSTALAVLQEMVQRFNAEAATVHLEQDAQQIGRSPEQVMVVASLLQAEGGKVSDYPKIARVIYNRLAKGMPLQLDSTVFYGLGSYGTRATDADIRSDSPYNTYKVKGLPPGPIDNPGDTAIQAALHPAAGNWLYFVTVNLNTGETKFTNSFTQFEQFQQELAHNMGKG